MTRVALVLIANALPERADPLAHRGDQPAPNVGGLRLGLVVPALRSRVGRHRRIVRSDPEGAPKEPPKFELLGRRYPSRSISRATAFATSSMIVTLASSQRLCSVVASRTSSTM